MADTEHNAATASGLGFLPKLLLVSLALLFGYLYLSADGRYGPSEGDASKAIAEGDAMPQTVPTQQATATKPAETSSMGVMPTHANRALAEPTVRVAAPAAVAPPTDPAPAPASAPELVSAPTQPASAQPASAQPSVAATEAVRSSPAPMMRPMPPQMQPPQMQPPQMQPPQPTPNAAARKCSLA
jgi:hypothetical protein